LGAVAFGGGYTVGDFGGLGCAVVAVVAGEVCGEGVGVPDPGAEPVTKHP
jgi:hypothetical protein